MKVYLVRHGQTTLNSLGIHQPANATLSQLGNKQAADLAERVSHLTISKIITSSHTRAVETAEIINKKLHKKIIHSDLFVEQKRPSEVENESHRNEEVISIQKEIVENFADPMWHYSDEENYYDVLDRALQALAYLEEQGDKDILVVSHGTFLKMLLGVMIFGGDFAPSMAINFLETLHVKNSGITMTEFKDGKWKVLTWNDYAHLGE